MILKGFGFAMTELLTPEEVREIQKGPTQSWPNTTRLCRDYLTLWERNEELEQKREGLKDIITELMGVA